MTETVGELSSEATDVYRVLADRGAQPADALAETLSLAVGDVDVAVEELESAGLVEAAPSGAPDIRVGEEAALHGLLSRRSPPLESRALLHARRSLDRVLLAPDAESTGLERITDLGALIDRLGQLMAQSRREVFNLHAGGVPSQQVLDAAMDDDLSLLDRGVALRTVCPHEFIEHERWRTSVELMGERGALTRFADGVPHRMLVFDRQVAVLPIRPEEPQAGGIVVRHPVVVRALHQLAATILRNSRALSEAVASTERPTELDRKVLLLMSAGLTDALSARKLSVTERQFRRYVARVMERLDAQSRFQAGVKAVERGWL